MKYIRRLLALIFLCLLCVCGFLGYQGYTRYEEALKTASIEQKVAEIKTNPSYTTFEELPDMYLDAVIAVEDKRFYEHPGIDIIAIARAIKNDIQAGALIEGGSTITQQIAKNLYFDQERSLTRKIAEAFMALDMEQTYSKQELLELYVNSICFGDGYYCVADASNGYYGKPPQEMTDYESTMLAGIPNAPSAYAPTVNPDLAALRQKKVLESMVDEKYLSRTEADRILQQEQNIS